MVEEKPAESRVFINLGVVLNNKGEVLVIKRAKEEIGKNQRKLAWAFPGGKQRIRESRVEGVVREVLAETGYRVSPLKEITLKIHPEFSVIIAYHLCRLDSPKPIQPPSEPWEIEEIRWVKPEELPRLFTTSLDPTVAQELKII